MKQSYFTSPGFTFRLQPFGATTALFLLFFLLNFSFGFGQTEPSFHWLDDYVLGSGGLDDEGGIVISVDTDSEGNVYVLTYGSGVYKYDPYTEEYEVVIPDIYGESDDLNNPLDLAIDNNDIIHIADSGSKSIKRFTTDGTELEKIGGSFGSDENEFFEPRGLEFDSDNNLYIVDAYRGETEVRNRNILRIYYANGDYRGFIGTDEHPLNNPYRVAVTDDYILISNAENNGEVLVFNKDLTFNSTLENIGSPGSLFVDKSGFIYAVDYADRLKFTDIFELLNGNFLVALTLRPQIIEGINSGDFKIQVYNSDLSHSSTISDFPANSNDDHIQFPLDITLDSTCGKLFLNDATISGLATLDSNLEIYQRTPSYDQEKPEIECSEDKIVTAQAGNDFAIVNYENPTAIDNCDNDVDIQKSAGLESGSEFPIGNSEVEFTATDDSGNVATCILKITVNPADEGEDTPPVFDNCPSDINKENDPGECSAIATFQTPTATDENGNVEVVRTDTTGLNSGDQFPVGITIITFQAEDGENDPVTCTFQIKIIDSENPVISDCPLENIEFTIQEGETYPLPDYTDQVTVEDNCDTGLEPVQDPPPGTPIDADEVVTLTVTDEAGNVSNVCSFTVEIIVEENNPAAPQFEDCPTLIQRNINTVECEALVIFDEPTASDDSGELAVNLVSELGSGDLFPVGTTRVTYEATGQNGETITCSFVVEIIDENLPEIVLCPENIEVEIASGENAIPVTYPNPEFTDRCGIVDIQRTGPASGEDFPLGRTVVTYTAFDENDNEISCSFEVLVERENESAEFEYRCIEEAEIPNITLDEDCELNIPSYTFFVQAQNFNPAMTQTYEKLTEDTYLITVEIREFGSDEFVGECEFLVNVVDLIPPGISCPNDQIESFDPDTGFEVPNYENMAGISDNCGEVSFRQEPAAGEIIYNNTTVNLFVENEGGLEASCSFELELTEADVLNISCLIDKNVNPDDNCSFWLPDYTSNADVNFPGADITQTPPVGTILTESTQIKLTASLNGETDECYFMVNLVDDQDPVANCVSGYVVNLDNNGTASITPEDLDNNSTDNCGIVSMALSQVDFTTADIGNVPVTLTVRDDAGNIDSCETTVEVRGEASGEFECRENIEVFLDENGEANLNIQELYTGDASGLNLEASRLNFTCEDLGAAFIQLDYSGDETGSCTINVYVRDELPPEINTNLVELTLDNEGFAYLEESDISAEDNCSEELIYRFSKSVFTCKEVGMNSVNVEVEDINGNKNDKNIHVRISGEGCDLPEPGENEYLFLYPNPNNGIFTIATPEGMFIEQVRVFDSRGRYIMQQDYNANARFYRMTIQGVEESVYTLQIFTNEGVIVKRAIIKR